MDKARETFNKGGKGYGLRRTEIGLTMAVTQDGAIARATAVHGVLKENRVELVAHVPDGGHADLISLCERDPSVKTLVLTTEEEGVALLAGAWLGGKRGALLIQSSGVGNCVNTFSLVKTCRVPLLLLVTMRGQWGEQMPWQVPMGQATHAVLEAMGIIVYEVDESSAVPETVDAAARLAFGSNEAVAVLISQRVLGAKRFD